jgi:hypothetical protein
VYELHISETVFTRVLFSVKCMHPKQLCSLVSLHVSVRVTKQESGVREAGGPLALRTIYHLPRVQYLPLARLLTPPRGPKLHETAKTRLEAKCWHEKLQGKKLLQDGSFAVGVTKISHDVRFKERHVFILDIC